MSKHTKDTYSDRFECRLSTRHTNALNRLTYYAGLESRSHWIRNQIERQAKLKNVWPEDNEK